MESVIKLPKKIDEFISTGQLAKLNKIRANDKNVAINELTKVSGIGPSAAAMFVKDGIMNIADLRKNIDSLNHHQKIGLNHFDDFELRIPREELIELRDIAKREIKDMDERYTADVCGSFRRGATSSGDIDILLTHTKFASSDKKNPELLTKVVQRLTACGLITDKISMGDSKFMGVCRLPKSEKKDEEDEGKIRHFRRLDLRLIPHDQYYCALLYFTGSDMFNKDMRGKALENGFTLNEYTIRPMGSTRIPGEPLPVSSEEDIFDYIGMKYKKPSERNL